MKNILLLALLLLAMCAPRAAEITITYPLYSTSTIYTTNGTAFTTDYIWGWSTNTIFRVNNGSGTLQYIQVINSTNAPINISLYSAQTNAFVHNTLWTNSAAGPGNSLCAPIVIYATDYTKRGTNYCAGKTVSIPIRSTANNRDVIAIITAGTPTATYPQNLSTNAILNLSGISD
jgi:hypothetical protein